MKTQSLAAAAREFFGVRPGTTTVDFMKEIKALTPQDRIEIYDGLTDAGYSIVDQTIARGEPLPTGNVQ
jgi:hypothetical protein